MENSLRAQVLRGLVEKRGLLLEVIKVGVGIFLFYLARGLMPAHPAAATERSKELFELEQQLHIAKEAVVQTWTLNYEMLVHYFNVIYIYGHFPIIVILLAILYFRHREGYRVLRNSLLISALAGLLIWYLLPVAPPRLLSHYSFTDTLAIMPVRGGDLQPDFFANRYAAVPSFHAGWALLMEIVIWRATKRADIRAFTLLLTLSMFIGVVATGNHYFLDVLIGSVIVMGALLLALWWEKYGSRTRVPPRRREPPSAPIADLLARHRA
ncbi:MAG: phosphatase PAP2 family protein [Chloroflexota bacterium]|nr:phosphatase PAP2 family protein [Chloroflexota bacterium]